MTGWMIETLVWTALLIGLVLLIRRPVARWFGPQVAYALWALPMLRLILPPIELPASMRPVEETAAPVTPALGQDPLPILDPAVSPIDVVATSEGVAASEAAVSDVPASAIPAFSFEFGPLLELAFAVWLIGAAIFLYMRFGAYFRLRDELLSDACEVGVTRIARGDKVRLVETAGTESPLAFGVIDKVIALPPGFLAQPDRRARDLALAHELAHHEGRDLLINVLVQPLFALHWFNPLGRYGWLALRRDQEAACDARVFAAMAPEERPETRTEYANLIVKFAAGPNVAPSHALAAPMACPVLGEKSIIHRLRSLKMNDTPKSRRIAGRLMLGAAVLALPMTASISYAASELPQASEPPAAPAPPVPPATASAPVPPVAPPAPPAEMVEDVDVIVEIDPDTAVSGDRVRDEQVFVYRDMDEREKRWTYRMVHREEARAERSRSRDRDRRSSREYRSRHFSEEDMDEIMAEVREALEESRQTLDELPAIIEQAMAESEGARGTRVVMSCDSNSDDVSTTVQNADGTHTVTICRTRIMAQALDGLKEARAEIAANREMSEEMRNRVTRELDQQIERWERSAR